MEKTFQWLFSFLCLKCLLLASFWVFLMQLVGRLENVFLWLFINFPDVGEIPSIALKYAEWQESCCVPLVKLLFGFLARTLQGLWVIHNPRWDLIAFGCGAPRGESWRLYRIPIWGGAQQLKGLLHSPAECVVDSDVFYSFTNKRQITNPTAERDRRNHAKSECAF